MKKFFVLLIVLVFTSLVFAQASFDKDAVNWHKDAIMTCGMLKKMESFNQQAMLQKLDALIKGLNDIQSKYINNPPAEYKNDPMWKMYFVLQLDNLENIKAKVTHEQYQLARVYCANICKTFGRMHRNNGMTDLTDMMFSLRMEIMSTMEIFSAHNYAGAVKNISSLKKLFNQVVEKVKVRNNKKFDALFMPLKLAVQKWITAIEKSDKPAVKASIKQFMAKFAKPYIATL